MKQAKKNLININIYILYAHMIKNEMESIKTLFINGKVKERNEVKVPKFLMKIYIIEHLYNIMSTC